jgi:hypothetical protein
MTGRPVTSVSGPAQIPAIPARLEPDATGVTQDTVIGPASSAQEAAVGLTLAAPGPEPRSPGPWDSHVTSGLGRSSFSGRGYSLLPSALAYW